MKKRDLVEALEEETARADMLERKLWESIVMGATFAEMAADAQGVTATQLIAAYVVGRQS